MHLSLTILGLCAVIHLSAQTPKQLLGLEYRGTGEAEHKEGCEGCGNPGHVLFETKDQLDYTLPGADIIGSLSYTRKGNIIRFEEGDWTMELKGDSLFFTAYDYRHSYILKKD